MYQNLQNRVIYFLNNNGGGGGGEEGGGCLRGGKALKCHSTQTRITTKASESKHSHGIHQHPPQLCRTEQTVVKPFISQEPSSPILSVPNTSFTQGAIFPLT